MSLVTKPCKESGGICDCCGNESKTIWGDVSEHEQTIAVYYVQWTVGSPEHNPNIDIVLGPWGDGADASQRVLVSLSFQPGRDGGSFMIVDGEGRPADSRNLCGRALKRAEVIGTPLADEVFEIVDSVWIHDPRIEGVKALNRET